MTTPAPDLPADPHDASAPFDADSSVPLGPGDPRPGRAPDGPTALVIDPDAVTRSRLAADLTTEGYVVWTCPGPCGATQCAGRDGGTGSQRCPRLPPAVVLVAVDQASARTRLLDAYASWAPAARIEITGTLALPNDQPWSG